jgi:hypothetical protein
MGAAPRLVKGVQAALYRQAAARIVKLTEEENTDG